MTKPDDDRNAPSSSSLSTVRRKSRSSRRRRRRRVIARIGLLLLGLLVFSGVALGLLAHQVSEVKTHFVQATESAPQLRAQLSDGNFTDATQTFEQISDNISSARSTATGPLWKIASLVPIAGPNLSAISEVTVAADDVAARAIAPLLGKSGSLDWRMLSPIDGKVDVSGLQDAAPTIAAAANTVELSLDRISTIDSSDLLPQIASPVTSATDQLRLLNSALQSAYSASQLLPTMLGAEEPRNYLLLVQNNSETRATGGIPGALAILRADNGRTTLGTQSSAASLGSFKPSIGVDPQQEALYSARLGTQMQNVNLTPDFPTAASTAKRMWEMRHKDQNIDGVLALDPIVLSHLLDATGPVALSDPGILALTEGTSLPSSLTSENVVDTLLADVYREINAPDDQDKYFAAVAGEVFSQITQGRVDANALISSLSKSVQEHRLLLWSNRVAEQEIVAATALSGSVNSAGDNGSTFGMYLNDGTGGKMDYYAKRSVQLVQSCPAGNYVQYTVRITVTNNAPADAASSLPAYVTGDGVFGVEPGRIRTNYVVYGPSLAFIETATVNGQSVPVSSGQHGPRQVGTVSLELGEGETATIEMSFSKIAQDSEPQLRVTPTIQPLEDVILPLERETCP